MSSIWTPDGEPPRPRDDAPSSPLRPPAGGPAAGGQPSDDELEAMLAEELATIQNTPAGPIVGNHAIQLFELARIYLTAEPPRFADAQLAIDAMAALVEGLSGRLGEDEGVLRDGLAQIRMAFVQIRGAMG